jgi:hypothetical protein
MVPVLFRPNASNWELPRLRCPWRDGQPTTESHDRVVECVRRGDSVVNGLPQAGSRVTRYIASADARAEIASSTAISA